ncbi:glycosyltransferase [Bacillus sp. m3-13]|uniref:glycosyltransferase n=1 Tax=Bacillus sp. m3-13 TaxID=406124 RepID=UPI0001E89E11|nr:glycosyltransferase [Bacillus sp. m3-13]
MKNKPIRVLHVLNGLGSGGTESFIMNIYRNIDRSKVQFDFLIRSTKDNLLKNEIEKLGGKVYITSEFPRHFIKNYREINEFFKRNKDYNIVHVHANALMYVKPLKIAKKYGVNCRIIHSHNTQTANNPLYKYIHHWNKRFISEQATDFFACSKMAGDWMFNNSYKVINNAIDVNKFQFNEEKRKKVRELFKLENKFVIGHIGRFTYQKKSFVFD